MKKNWKPSVILAAVLAALLALPAIVAACSCYPAGTVDTKFDGSQDVAVFKVQSIQKYSRSDLDRGEYGVDGIKSAKLSVERVFKGTLKVGDQLTFRQGQGGNCVWTFTAENIGEEFLFYLGEEAGKEESGVWHASECSGSGELFSAMADISYIEEISSVRGKTRVSGFLTQRFDSATGEVPWVHKPLAGRMVRIRGNGRDIRLKTDTNGVYEVYGLPPGDYTITPGKIAGYRSGNMDEAGARRIELKARGHSEESFIYGISNAVRGRLVGPGGGGLPGVTLELQPVSGDAHKYFKYKMITRTQSDGKFEFTDVPPETYVIAVNPEGKITSVMPFGIFYSPGKKAREEAARTTIGPGDRLEYLTITAPELAETVTISGTVTYEDGKPAAGRRIKFFSEDSAWWRRRDVGPVDPDVKTESDVKGRFTLKVLKGQKGIIIGSLYHYPRDSRPCPKADDLARLSSPRELETPEIFIDASADQGGHELKFPFPLCE